MKGLTCGSIVLAYSRSPIFYFSQSIRLLTYRGDLLVRNIEDISLYSHMLLFRFFYYINSRAHLSIAFFDDCMMRLI